ncbi:GNAT family N-acetyltransferase [Longibacter salinarum]|uniref:GNAT family N-acetyltransferase n=1 Tax=Longibacter salinarum TaxID=1850348 RepID=A0A2A8CWT8_9BACT|nr:GNAT family N-acetyltransferase [Longibacter salinarum]PEN13080.1 GNAT family N-acetyltransferase [Longibacter salinarum]
MLSTDSVKATDSPDLTIYRVGRDRVDLIRDLNESVFGDRHVINRFDHDDLLMLVAERNGDPVGFKVGYRLRTDTFYSAKGGVVDHARRQGIARALLQQMLSVVEQWGYIRFVYDTFPNKHPGMTVLGLREGFEVIKAGYSPQYEDYRLRFECRLTPPAPNHKES